MHRLLPRVPKLLDVIAVVAVVFSILYAASPYLNVSLRAQAVDTGRCDIGEFECDPDQNYVWQGSCYTDDGCYYNLETCC